MRNETLLTKAIQNYNVAQMIFSQMNGDESYLNFIGYHLQQCVELSIKYQLETNGVEYPKSHDIDQLLRIGRENDADIFTTEYIENKSEMFTLWESRTRYILNYQLEYNKVTQALQEVHTYMQELIQLERNQEINSDAEREDGPTVTGKQNIQRDEDEIEL